MSQEIISPLRLTVDFEGVQLGQFAKFFLGFRSLTLRSLIIQLQSEEPSESLRLLAKSYVAFLTENFERKYGQPHDFGHSFRNRLDYVPHEAFALPLVANTFDDWADQTLSTSDIVVESVEQGSMVVVLGMAALLHLAEVPYNYSMMKDIVMMSMNRIKDAIDGKNVVSTSLKHVPQSIVDLAKNPKVKRLDYAWDGDSGELKVEKFHP